MSSFNRDYAKQDWIKLPIKRHDFLKPEHLNGVSNGLIAASFFLLIYALKYF